MSEVDPNQSISGLQTPADLKSPTESIKSPSTDVPATSSSTDTPEDGPYEDLPHDMMASSYTEISFGESDLEDCIEADEGECSEMGDANQDKQIPGSLSLPQLSNTIIDWSEKAKAEYEAEYGDEPVTRPATGQKDDITGNIEYSTDGMVSFVAHDLEAKLRLSSIPSSPSTSSSIGDPSSSNSATLEIAFLNKLEFQAQQISANLDHLMKHIANYTTQVTSSTLRSVETFENCLNETCDSVDSNIKSMYQLMAKYEEMGSVMAPVFKLADEVKEVKRLLMLLEREMETNRYQ